MGGGGKGEKTACAILHTPSHTFPAILSLSLSVYIIIPVLPDSSPHLICNDQDPVLVAQQPHTILHLPTLPHTSSAMTRIPCLSHSARRALIKPGGGERKPPSPRIGSRNTAAVSKGAVCICNIHSRD